MRNRHRALSGDGIRIGARLRETLELRRGDGLQRVQRKLRRARRRPSLAREKREHERADRRRNAAADKGDKARLEAGGRAAAFRYTEGQGTLRQQSARAFGELGGRDEDELGAQRLVEAAHCTAIVSRLVTLAIPRPREGEPAGACAKLHPCGGLCSFSSSCSPCPRAPRRSRSGARSSSIRGTRTVP